MTFTTSSEDFPHLSPDGETLLVDSDRGGKRALWTMDLEGKVLLSGHYRYSKRRFLRSQVVAGW